MPLAKRKHSPSPELSDSVPARNLRPRKAKQSNAPVPPPPVPRPRQSKAKKQRQEARKVRSSTAEMNHSVLPPHLPHRGVKTVTTTADHAVPSSLTPDQVACLGQHLGIDLIHSTKFNKRRCECATHPLWTVVLQKICNRYFGLMIPTPQYRMTALLLDSAAASATGDGATGNTLAMDVKKKGELEGSVAEGSSQSSASGSTSISILSLHDSSVQTPPPQPTPPSPASSATQSESSSIGNASQTNANQQSSSNPTPPPNSISASSFNTEPAERGAWAEKIPDFCVILMRAVVRKGIDLKAIVQSQQYDLSDNTVIGAILADDTQIPNKIFAIVRLHIPLLVELKRSVTRHPENIEDYTDSFVGLIRAAQSQALQQSSCLFLSDDYKQQDKVILLAVFGEWWSFRETTRDLHALDNRHTSPQKITENELDDLGDEEYLPPGAPLGSSRGISTSKVKIPQNRRAPLSKAIIKKLDDLNDKATYPYRDKDVNQCSGLLSVTSQRDLCIDR